MKATTKTSNRHWVGTCPLQSTSLVALVALLGGALNIGATAITATNTGNWSTPATWSPNQVPIAGDDVTIGSGFTVTVDTTAACGSVTFGAGADATLNLNAGVTLSVSGILTIPRPSGINTVAVGNGFLNAGHIAFINGGTTQRHFLTINNGTVTVAGDVYTVATTTTSAAITFTGAGLLRVGGGFFPPLGASVGGDTATANGGGVLTAGTGTVEYNGAAQTVTGFAYNNLTLSGSGAKALDASSSVAGILKIVPAGSPLASVASGDYVNANILAFGSVGQSSGTWGSSGSSAAHQTDTYFDSSVSGILTVAVDSPTACDIVAFPAGAIDPVARTITLYVRAGTDLAHLAPAYAASPFATGSPASGAAPTPSFAVSGSATYTITAQDGITTKSYTVTIAYSELPVHGALACWYDANSGVTTSGSTVTQWADESGNGHAATSGSGSPQLVTGDINGKPAVHIRGSSTWLNCAGGMFTKEQYVVVRSPSANWNGTGTFLGRASADFLSVRYSSYNLDNGTPGFWQDHNPAAVSKNGTVIPQNANVPSGGCYYAGIAPITNYMILKITVDDTATAANLAQYPYYQIGRNETLGSADMDIAEIIGYTNTLSPADEALVGGYLAEKYWLTTAYPPLYLALQINNPVANQQYPFGTPISATATLAEPNSALTDTVKFYTKLLPAGAPVQWSSTQSGTLFTANLGALASGTYQIYATVTNNATPIPGTATTATNTFTVAAATATSTTLGSSVNPSAYGQSVTFTATVSPTPNGGTVQFYTNAVALGGPVAVDSGTGQAQVSTTYLAAGADLVTAAYGGYGIYLPSSTANALTQTVTKAVLTVTAYNKVRSPGTNNPPFTCQITGFQNGENATSALVTGAPVLGTQATPASPVGNYVITNSVGTLTAPNYSFTTVNGTLKVMAGAPPLVAGELVCWYDAGAGITQDGSGVANWDDQTPNGHLATRGGDSPQLALSDINGRPAVQLRGGNCYLACAGGMFTKEQYVVARSPNATWNGNGSFLGRASSVFYTVRDSSYNLYNGYTGFWDDQLPAAVSRNGTVVSSSRGSMPRGGFELGTITDYMLLKITVNANATAANLAAYPYYDIGKNETLGTCDMDIAEIIGYDSALSSGDEAAVGLFLSTKYGLNTAYMPLPPPPAPVLGPGGFSVQYGYPTFTFSTVPGNYYRLVSSTNVAAPLNQWQGVYIASPVASDANGWIQATDTSMTLQDPTSTTGIPQLYYRIEAASAAP